MSGPGSNGNGALTRRDGEADVPGCARAQRLLDAYTAGAVRALGSGALGVVDLPPLTGAQLDADQVRVSGTLLWAREVESAGLPALVEALAEGVVRGTLIVAITTGGDRLMQYWRGRHERFDEGERQAMYERVFGAPGSGSDFESLFALWLRWLSHVGRLPSNADTTRARVRVQTSGRDVAQLLSDRAVGMVAFLARDVVAHIRAAIDILRDPDIARALGGSPWNIVRLHAPQLLGRHPDIETHLARAAAGAALVGWLADHALALGGGSLAIERGDPVISAAERWLSTVPPEVEA